MVAGCVDNKLSILKAILHMHYNPNDYLCPGVQTCTLQVTVSYGFVWVFFSG